MAEMNTNTAELLQQMIDIKKDMRTAIGNKGVTVVSGMVSYPSAIESIQQEIVGGEVKLPDGTKFKGSKFTTIPQFDTSAMTDMSKMFYDCHNLTTIPQLDTSNVRNMDDMFNWCDALTTIPQLDTSNVMFMDHMFTSCYDLVSIPQFDTSNVINMDYIFSSCYSLTTIPQLDTSNVMYMDSMFSGNYNLKDLGGFINLGSKLIGTSAVLDFNNSNLLTTTSVLNVFNTIASVSTAKKCTIRLHPDVLNTLSADDIAIATNKGWTIESA